MLVIVRRLRETRVDAPYGIDELLDRNVAVAALPIKVPALSRGVFHAGKRRGRISHTARVWDGGNNALERVHPGLARIVIREVIPSVALVHIDFTLCALTHKYHSSQGVACRKRTEWRHYLLCHIIPVLRGMHAGVQGRGPACCVHCGALVCLALHGRPVDQERNRVLCLRNTVVRLACGDARGGTGDDARRDGDAIEDPAADVDVMRGKVIAGAS